MPLQRVIPPKKLAAKRSPKWPAVRRKHLKLQPTCMACGTLMNLEVHHIHPVHVYPDQELDPTNLITLCETPTNFCHYIFGHLGLSWYKWDPSVGVNAKGHMNAVEYAIEKEDLDGKIIIG
jgi:5-methylcytosine-specific restriction enzyme A